MYDVFDIIVKNKKIRQKTNSLMNKTNIINETSYRY